MLQKLRATRKEAEEIEVVEITEDNLEELIEMEYLERVDQQVMIHQKVNQNPSIVHVGDYLRIDKLDDIYPISAEAFDKKFRIIDKE